MANYLTLAVDITLPEFHLFMTSFSTVGESYISMNQRMEVELDRLLELYKVDISGLFKMIAVRYIILLLPNNCNVTYMIVFLGLVVMILYLSARYTEDFT